MRSLRNILAVELVKPLNPTQTPNLPRMQDTCQNLALPHALLKPTSRANQPHLTLALACLRRERAKKKGEKGEAFQMVSAMGDRTASAILALLLFSSWTLMAVMAYQGRGMEGREKREEEEAPGSPQRRGRFILRSKEVVKTDAGEVRLVMGYRYRGNTSPMHIGFITMEPNTLYIPQYIDASLILFVHRGKHPSPSLLDITIRRPFACMHAFEHEDV